MMHSFCKNIQLLEKHLSKLHHVPSATYLHLRIPPTYDDVEFPESRKLMMLDKVPPSEIVRRFKMQKMKHLMRGEELIHNKLQYGQYGVQVLQGGRLYMKHIEHIRLFINKRIDERRMFAMWRIEAPWQAITKKSSGVRMGGGKKSIYGYVYPFKPRRIILELGGHMEFEECEYLLNHVANILPVKARAVSRQILEEEDKKERKYQEENLNPFNFMYCARNNFVGIKEEISKYEWMTEGRFR